MNVGHDIEPRCWVGRVWPVAGSMVLAALLGLGGGWLLHERALAASAVSMARIQEQRDEIIRRLERIEGKIDRLESR
jgi:hypothetical protein